MEEEIKKSKINHKYWYRTDIECCVLCGYEIKYKFRVYKEEDKGIYIYDYACPHHFM